MRFIKGYLLILMLFWGLSAVATHQRAAEITYRWVQGLTYEVTITMYTYTPSPADDVRTSLPIIWGDNSQSEIPRIQFQALADNYTLNIYQMNHTFPGSGNYIISVEDPNRNFGVVNIPNSVNVPIYVESLLVINPFLEENNSVQLLNPPIDQGCVGKIYIHNPSAFDPDEDSLSYKLVNCRGMQGLEIPGYTLPLASTSFEIDPVTGDLTWDAPVLQGEYNVAFEIEEWRSGTKIGSVVRDMQILIGACDNNPPVITMASNHCVVAGNQLTFDVSATDPDNNGVTLTATGAPFEDSNPATLIPDPATGTPTASTTFYWNTTCQQVRKISYNALFKAKDNHPEVSLTAFQSTVISVVAPAVDEFTGEALGKGINLSWNYSQCENSKGFYLYRRNGISDFVPGECQSGVPGSAGFSRIAIITDRNINSYRDDDQGQGLVPGVDYCYLITAYFEDGAESIASFQVCASLKRDLPVITNVSNDSLNLAQGKVLLAWAPPTELDVNQYPGPYTYQVYRLNGADPQLVYNGIGLNDTICSDATFNLNNLGSEAVYEVLLKSETVGEIGSSKRAASVFLQAVPTDKALLLSWTANVPWTNDSTEIYKQNGGVFTKIGSSLTDSFLDEGLENGQEYTYYVKTTGGYSTTGFVDPIINYSQIVTAIPKDIVAPCPPDISVETDCKEISNLIKINRLYDSCYVDTKEYQIFYTISSGTDFSLLATIPANQTEFLHQGIDFVTACYYVKAIDSTGNISDASNTVCIDWDTCPLYELPNVFTPNGDNFNDLFIPMNYPSTNPKANVERVEMTIFNRWGNVVFKTTEPAINWDGKDEKTGKDCAEGTYFYTCKVFFQTLEGLIEQQLQGSVAIVR